MDSLKGQLLIAAPMLVDPNFHRTVVLIMEHSDEGALGVVLNRPTELAVGEAVPDLAELADGDPVFAGGPVQPQAVIALAEHTGPVGDESVCGPIAPIQVSDDIEDMSGHVARVLNGDYVGGFLADRNGLGTGGFHRHERILMREQNRLGGF